MFKLPLPALLAFAIGSSTDLACTDNPFTHGRKPDIGYPDIGPDHTHGRIMGLFFRLRKRLCEATGSTNAGVGLTCLDGGR